MSLTRRLILQKARHHHTMSALTACRHTVSGTLSLPSRGTFHHSLTVLIRYRSSRSIQAYRVVPADSQQIPRARCYSGNNTNRHAAFTYRALTVYGRPSQATSTNHTLLPTSRIELDRVIPTTPHTQPLPGITCVRFSHPPRSLATTNGITICFLLLRVLRCFTSPRSPQTAIHSPPGDTTSLVPGYPIRTSSDPRSVDSSPRHIAASHVLHRLSMPRHPPCAL